MVSKANAIVLIIFLLFSSIAVIYVCSKSKISFFAQKLYDSRRARSQSHPDPEPGAVDGATAAASAVAQTGNDNS
ncbi:hypothetical protein CDD82_5710 [Ophiocordyceps australis]|uniref:Uncharacterized protein n=1 Tax=Ophiocordyceps australis TaxID=1399860 RepID=A0A2C5Y3S4_9HYPO|nr:hypothetical protein CDD82_5710 [Ophiocordyceps australis]